LFSDTHLQYLIVMALCLVATAPLEIFFKAKVYRQPIKLILSVLPVALVFSVFDVISIADSWWHYSKRYTTGILLPGRLPIEELTFFIVIPICALLTYEAVGNIMGKRKGTDN
jgi:lycopene cyclase domain-containing protein